MVRRGPGRPPHPDVLTPAEWAVLDLWRHGLTMAAIGARRGMSRDGVRYHLRNAAGKLGVGTTATLRHWPGFPIDSPRHYRQSADPQRRSATMPGTGSIQLGPLGQVSMLTRSAERAEGWYRDTLQLAHVFTFGDLVFFWCGETRLYIREVPDDQWRPSSILYFLVPDIGAAHRELGERGVHFQGAPHRIYRDDATGLEEWMAFFDDPDGNTLAIMARVAPATVEAAAATDGLSQTDTP